jgi:tetratricopeptide (TPR) repeat protein
LDALSVFLLEQGRMDEAIESLREALAAAAAQKHPNLSAELRLAQALFSQARCDEALAVLRTATESARQIASRDKSRRFVGFLASAIILQGRCLAQTGRTAEAAVLLQEACELSFRPAAGIPRHPVFDLAQILRNQGKPVEADAALESALRLANREGNEFVFQLLPAVYRSVRATQGADHAAALIREQLVSETAWLEQAGPVAAAPYSLAVLCAAAEVGAFGVIAPVVRARLAWWEQHTTDKAPAHAYATIAGEVLLAEGRQDEAERVLLVAAEGLERTKNYWRFETLWRGGYLDGALARFYTVCTRPEEPGRWRHFMVGGDDPEWELNLARSLFEAGRYREAAEILPGARTRLDERLARKPDNDRLNAIGSDAATLWKDCLARMESSRQVGGGATVRK